MGAGAGLSFPLARTGEGGILCAMRFGAQTIVYLAGLALGSIVRVFSTLPSRGNVCVFARASGVGRVLLSLASLGMIAPLFAVFTPWLSFADYELPSWTAWPGGVVFAGAIVLLWRCHGDLGRNWSARLEIREGHTLVTAGIYRHIRHPMYTAHLLWGIAQALLIGNWIAGPAFLIFFVPLYLERAPREEAMLIERFGEEYREYARRTGGLWPRRKR